MLPAFEPIIYSMFDMTHFMKNNEMGVFQDGLTYGRYFYVPELPIPAVVKLPQ